MLLQQDNGTFLAGPADIICILQLPKGIYHAAFFEEHPMAGQTKPINELEFLRLKSKMHHTTGADTLEGAQEHVKEMREKIILSDDNIMIDEAIPVTDPVNVWPVLNWTKGNMTLKEALGI